MNKIKKIISYVLYVFLCSIFFCIGHYIGDSNCEKVILSDEIKICEEKRGEFSLRYNRYLQEYQTECELPAKTIFENTYK
jgi:hypothetical protein